MTNWRGMQKRVVVKIIARKLNTVSELVIILEIGEH